MTSPADQSGQPLSRIPFEATHPPLTRAAAQKRSPESAIEVIDRLAAIWDEVVHRIIGEMMDLASAERVPLHINLREEMVLELAQLQIWLGERVVEKRMTGRDLALVDVEREREGCLGPQGAGIITSTARMAYERIWLKRMEERWKPKTARAIEREATPRQAKLAIKSVGKNHFIPRWFIRDNWAVDGKVLRWRHGTEGWSSRRLGFGQWGFRRNLHSDRLEAYFGLLEGDAKKPVQMLLETNPLNGPQRESLVGFLIIQVLRNPSFIDKVRKGLEPELAELGHANDTKMPQKAYEALYRNNDLYHQLAHPIMWSRWAIVEAQSPVFVLPDTFGVRGDFGDGLRLIAPLTPHACFVTLPRRETEKRIVPLRLTNDDHIARRISTALICGAEEDFLSHTDFRPDARVEKISFGDILREIEATIERRTVF